MQASIELKRLRERAGLTMEKMASMLGYKRASGYQHYETVDKYTKAFLPLDMVLKLLDVFEGKGNPPIKAEEIVRLSGIEQGTIAKLYLASTRDTEKSKALLQGSVDLSVKISVFTSLDAGELMDFEPKGIPDTSYPQLYVDPGVNSAAIAMKLPDRSYRLT